MERELFTLNHSAVQATTINHNLQEDWRFLPQTFRRSYNDGASWACWEVSNNLEQCRPIINGKGKEIEVLGDTFFQKTQAIRKATQVVPLRT